MKYKALIFDLDGTLLDTLKGITDAVNATFKELGYDVQHDYVTARNFIGAGAYNFVKRACKGMDINEEQGALIGETFLKYYDKLQGPNTTLFPGIRELLDDLKKAGYLICLASNKPQILLEHVIDDKFPGFEFDVRLGQRKGIPCKPDPYVVREIEERFKLLPSECLYIGDSEYDYQTAHNAKIDCCIVKYGYGFYDQDFVKKSTYNVDSVKDLRKLLLD